MAWIYLLVAALFEMGWAIGLKYTEGFSKLIPSVITIALVIASFVFLSIAVRDLPVGTAYAVWTGIGVVGVAVFGILVLKEPADLMRLGSISLIVAGAIGLRLTTS
jgi:quaternary ammonium compound-resistance protein SugE